MATRCGFYCRWICKLYTSVPITISVAYDSNSKFDPACTTMWLFNSSPWKIHPFLRTVNPGKPSISMGRFPWHTVSHNQMVTQNWDLTGVLPSWCVLYILTWKYASRHKRVHFFDISTSKSAPKLVCFVQFDLEICFAPQPRALFATSQLPKVVRACGVF